MDGYSDEDESGPVYSMIKHDRKKSNDYVDIDILGSSPVSNRTEYFKMAPIPSASAQLTSNISQQTPRRPHGSIKSKRSRSSFKRSAVSLTSDRRMSTGTGRFVQTKYQTSCEDVKLPIRSNCLWNFKFSLIFVTIFVAIILALVLSIKVSEYYADRPNISKQNIKEFMKIVSSFDEDGMDERKGSLHTSLDIKDAHVSCCSRIRIVSNKEAASYWPQILGVYVQDESLATKYPAFRYDNDTQEIRLLLVTCRHATSRIFLSKPFNISSGKVYNWGVNSGLDKNWGWIKAVQEELCPDFVRDWIVWNEESSSWIYDQTLSVSCFPDL